MRVLERSIYRGPHYYSARPMIRVQLDLGRLEDYPTDRLPGFADALLAALPGLRRHHCSLGHEGGFVERMRDGTWLGHVAEHVALELQATAAAARVTRGKTRQVRGRRGVYNVLYAYEEEDVGRLAGRIALTLIDSLLPADLRGLEGLDRLHPPVRGADGGTFRLTPALEALADLARRRSLGPTTAAIAREARRRGIPVSRMDEHSLLRLGWGSRQKRLRASISGETSHIAVETAGDKHLTRRLLLEAGLPAPRGEVVRTAEEAVKAAAAIGGPVVTKPQDGNHGRGVSVGLTGEAAVRAGFSAAIAQGRRVIVEEMLPGRDHRILVVGGRVVAVAERVAARVIGDGRQSVRRLIEAANRDPRRGEGHEKVMTRIKVDEAVEARLAADGLTLDSVPAAGVAVQLRDTANLSTGGEAIDRTAEIHPENAAIARRAAKIVGLDIAGIDFLAPDITRPVRETGGGIVEINAAPGLRMHLEPSVGEGRNVAAPIIDLLFPRGAPSRIPVIAVTGTNGKSTSVRMIADIFRRLGRCVAYTSTSGVYVDGVRTRKSDASGPKSARQVLADPSIDVAVLETARGGILREGLAFDRCDVGVVLNVAEDHLGLAGVDTVEDLAKVKAVVAESVSRRGASVLNADDPMTLRMARHARGEIIWFSLRGGPDLPAQLQKHLAEGGRAVVLEPSVRGGEIVILEGDRRIPVMPAGDIPAALGGLARFNVANALAAVAAAHAQRVPVPIMAQALAAFASDHAQNPGRLNVHDAHGFRVIVDYAHNPAGLEALAEVVEGLRAAHGQTIGMLSIPGDRRDEDILKLGEIGARTFDRLVFRERPDGRGRKPGEVVDLLWRGAERAAFPAERMFKVPGEREAVRAALDMARPGDLVVLTPTDVDAVWAQVLAWRPAARGPARQARDTGRLDA